MGESLEAFEYISSVGNFNAVERVGAKYVGAVAMYIIGRRLKKRYVHVTFSTIVSSKVRSPQVKPKIFNSTLESFLRRHFRK